MAAVAKHNNGTIMHAPAAAVPEIRDGGAAMRATDSAPPAAADWSQLEIDERVLAELSWEIREVVRQSIWAAEGRRGRTGRGPSAVPTAGSRPQRGRQGSKSRPHDSWQHPGQLDIRRFHKPG
ncbi:hypothetical protein Vretimale_3905 [Volvox reticuliferus]|uniref:Uncharacterized protein n=1 Tax=Volvox reticuliferus TaxID=1737510 RepID=A0A8J4G200_9CHLO|nr:hypothetical protein Vretifemale_1509 [Volvox reticuliferus]GIL98535.1 hypothetical protein Vretimale_3905 [Volvox reticuliferus]